ncbi:hypothetical protein MVEN_00536200 [Mycena venus]|uniref:Uncharacterized protein n=1 Tax=Mycena venus TaxID=2733690 RepID=A0A8H6YL74_9AGAR|nr:hypothetical protein MVEN_00536200 [Mycena venus]
MSSQGVHTPSNLSPRPPHAAVENMIRTYCSCLPKKSVLRHSGWMGNCSPVQRIAASFASVTARRVSSTLIGSHAPYAPSSFNSPTHLAPPSGTPQKKLHLRSPPARPFRPRSVDGAPPAASGVPRAYPSAALAGSASARRH